MRGKLARRCRQAISAQEASVDPEKRKLIGVSRAAAEFPSVACVIIGRTLRIGAGSRQEVRAGWDGLIQVSLFLPTIA